jgi:hypothetical protein
MRLKCILSTTWSATLCSKLAKIWGILFSFNFLMIWWLSVHIRLFYMWPYICTHEKAKVRVMTAVPRYNLYLSNQKGGTLKHRNSTRWKQSLYSFARNEDTCDFWSSFLWRFNIYNSKKDLKCHFSVVVRYF